MTLRPAKPPHAGRKHTKSNMLSSTPPGIKFADLDLSSRKLRYRLNPSGINARFHKTDKVVKAIDTGSGKSEWDDDGLVEANLT